MKNNKRGSALIISIFITMIITIIGIFLLDKIMPLAKNVKWIENSNVAYYNANSWVEKALFDMNSSDPSLEPSWTGWTTISWYNFSTLANVSSIPQLLEWNSEYDKNFNKIWIWDPIQLVINSNTISWNNVIFNFKVPDLNWNWSNDEILSSNMAWTWIINWILSGSGKSAFASWELNMIKWSEIPTTTWNINGKNWVDLNWSGGTFASFYSQFNCIATEKCTLKLSLINPLSLSNWQIAPYLEYKIDSINPKIPNQYAKIISDWNSFWFKRTIKRNVQQVTSNEAMDFTVFQ